MNPISKYITRRYFLLALAILCGACAGRQDTYRGTPHLPTLSNRLKIQLRTIEQSIINLDTKIEYEIFTYNYLYQDDQLIRDARSPVKYKLDLTKGKRGISSTKDIKTIQGGGLLIDIDPDKLQHAILTSNHLVAPKDTLDVYYRDSEGYATDVLFARYILRSTVITVRSRSNWRVRATLIAKDQVHDLAVIEATTDNNMGIEYPGKLGYDLDLGWGDWVFLFGYPKGVKQLTSGLVSKSPYRGNLSVDAVVKFGYSGGPVFTVTEDEEIVFVGLIKSVPRTFLEYIAPDPSLPTGYQLNPEDFGKLQVKTETLVEYGTAYFVDPATIKTFLEDARESLFRAGVDLKPKYFGD